MIKQDKISLSFSRDKEIEQELLTWLKSKGELIGVSTVIKQYLYEEMKKEKSSK
ncbi:MAG: hypothetical protein ACRCTZ_01215 [Sarcina sp.]